VNLDHDDSVEDLIPKYLAGEASSDEERQLLGWLDRSPENNRVYQAARKVFEAARNHYAHEEKIHAIDIDHEWAQFRKRAESIEPSSAITRPLFGPWLRIAAGLILLAGIGFVVRYFVLRDTFTIIQTADLTKSVVLPDGSHAILNKHSSLRYSTRTDDSSRVVALTGEAFFEVVHDARNPFVVEIAGVRITDVGTAFDVRGYDERKILEVVVKEGAVNIAAPGSGSMNVAAGQRGIYEKANHHLAQAANTNPNFLSWETQQIVFTENDLATVVEILNHAYGAHIRIAAGVPSTCVVTVSFDHQTLDAVLHVLKTTLNLTYRIDGDTIEITQAGC
jgi:transmembrane sensor